MALMKIIAALLLTQQGAAIHLEKPDYVNDKGMLHKEKPSEDVLVPFSKHLAPVLDGHGSIRFNHTAGELN